MLKFDKHAIDEAFDRCQGGGHDNRNGMELDQEKFRKQVEDHIRVFVRDAKEAEEIREYASNLREPIESSEYPPEPCSVCGSRGGQRHG